MKHIKFTLKSLLDISALGDGYFFSLTFNDKIQYSVESRELVKKYSS